MPHHQPKIHAVFTADSIALQTSCWTTLRPLESPASYFISSNSSSFSVASSRRPQEFSRASIMPIDINLCRPSSNSSHFHFLQETAHLRTPFTKPAPQTQLASTQYIPFAKQPPNSPSTPSPMDRARSPDVRGFPAWILKSKTKHRNFQKGANPNSLYRISEPKSGESQRFPYQIEERLFRLTCI